MLPVMSETHLRVQQMQMWPFPIGSGDSWVGKLLRLKAGWPKNQISIHCSYKKPSSPALVPTQSPSRGTEGSSPGDKQSPAPSGVVKNLTAQVYWSSHLQGKAHNVGEGQHCQYRHFGLTSLTLATNSSPIRCQLLSVKCYPQFGASFSYLPPSAAPHKM